MSASLTPSLSNPRIHCLSLVHRYREKVMEHLPYDWRTATTPFRRWPLHRLQMQFPIDNPQSYRGICTIVELVGMSDFMVGRLLISGGPQQADCALLPI